MKRWLSVLLQILGGVVQVGNLLTPLVSTKQKLIIGSIVGIAQVGVNTIAHNSNPDGSPAEVAWTSK